MSATSLLLLALATAAATVPASPPAGAPDGARLALEGIGIGDSEGRLITLMPTASCADVEGDSGIADRWCRVPGQTVFGVLPLSLAATLSDGRIDTVIVRMPRRAWPLLRARLIERHGDPDTRVGPVQLPGAGTGELPEAGDQLRWTRDGITLAVTAPGTETDPVLTLSAEAPAAPATIDE